MVGHNTHLTCFSSLQKQLTEDVIIPGAHYRRKIFFPQPNLFFKAGSWFVYNAENNSECQSDNKHLCVCVFYCMNSNLKKQILSRGVNNALRWDAWETIKFERYWLFQPQYMRNQGEKKAGVFSDIKRSSQKNSLKLYKTHLLIIVPSHLPISENIRTYLDFWEPEFVN